MEYQQVLSENKDSTIAKKEEGSLPSEMPPQSIEHTDVKHESPKMYQKKPGSPTKTASIHSPGSATRRVMMDTEDKRDVNGLMVTGASINGSILNIKRYSVNQYANPMYGSTDLGPVMGQVMATTSSHNFG